MHLYIIVAAENFSTVARPSNATAAAVQAKVIIDKSRGEVSLLEQDTKCFLAYKK